MRVKGHTGTDVSQVNLDLASPAGRNTGDGAADSVIVKGTADADNIVVSGGAAGVTVKGLPAQVNITAPEAALDSLTVDPWAGNPVSHASPLAPPTPSLTPIRGDAHHPLTPRPGTNPPLPPPA